MRLLYWILILWQPIGSLCVFHYKYIIVMGVKLREIFTDRQYKLMVVDSGVLGPLTPLFNYFLRIYKREKKKDNRHVLKGADTSAKGISYV